MGNMKNELKSMFTEHWKYLALSATCELRLYDKIFQGQNSVDKLVKQNGWDLKTLQNLVYFLMNEKYLEHMNDGSFKLTERGNLLREENPDGLFYACLNWSGEHLIAWQNLKYSVQTGKSSFEKIYCKPYFDYLNDSPQKLRNYHKALYQYAIDDYKELPSIIDFSIHKSIMDVGGGFGAVISLIKENYPTIHCTLFDLEKVIQIVSVENIDRIAGNFFDEVPKIAEAIILSRVLHDWNDEKAKVIIKNCYCALPPNGTLYIIENCKDRDQTNLSLLSLNMTVMCQSCERSNSEYFELCNIEGFRFQSDIKLNELQTILIFKK